MKKSVGRILIGGLSISFIANLILLAFISEASYRQLDAVFHLNRALLASQGQIDDYLEDMPYKRSEDELFHNILYYTGQMSAPSNPLLSRTFRYLSHDQTYFTVIKHAYSEYKSNPTNESEEYWRNSLEEFVQGIEYASEVLEIYLEKYYDRGILKQIQFFILNKNPDHYNEWFPSYEYTPEPRN